MNEEIKKLLKEIFGYRYYPGIKKALAEDIGKAAKKIEELFENKSKT